MNQYQFEFELCHVIDLGLAKRICGNGPVYIHIQHIHGRRKLLIDARILIAHKTLQKHIDRKNFDLSAVVSIQDLTAECIGAICRHISKDITADTQAYIRWNSATKTYFILSLVQEYYHDDYLNLDTLLAHKYAYVFLQIEDLLHEYPEASIALNFNPRKKTVDVQVI